MQNEDAKNRFAWSVDGKLDGKPYGLNIKPSDFMGLMPPSGSAGRGWFRLAVFFRESSFRFRKFKSKQCVGFSSRFKSVQSVSFSSCLLDGKLDGKEGAGNETGSH